MFRNASSITRVMGALAALILLRSSGCAGVPDNPSGLPDSVTGLVQTVLANVGPQVVTPTLERYQSSADVLDQRLAEWASLTASGQPSTDAKLAAQLAYLDAARIWQQAEVHQLGPSASSLTAIDGEDLRDEIYSWPEAANPCRVDQETVAQGWDTADFFTANLVNTYGLDALEHVLFATAAHQCPTQANLDADWDVLGADGIDRQRAAFAVALSAGVNGQVNALIDAWSPNGGDYTGVLAQSGQQGNAYGTREEGLNAIYDALFYIELLTKDRKLARPIGLVDCATATCLSDLEAFESDDAVALIRANVVGFRALFTGGEAEGLDNLLIELGHDDLATNILDAADNAIAIADAMDTPLSTAIVDTPESAIALHEAVQALSDLIKGDLATVLTLQLPTEAGADAD